MRVLHLGKYYPPHRGGIETHLQALAHGLSAEGVEVTALVVNHAGAGGDVVWRAAARTRSASERDGPVRVERVGRVANVARLDLCPRLEDLLHVLVDREDDRAARPQAKHLFMCDTVVKVDATSSMSLLGRWHACDS